MNKYDENYSAYFAAPDEAYPLGSAVDASNEDNLDGTPILAAFFNDVIGFMQAIFFGVYGKDAQVSNSPESCKKSDVWNAIQKFVGDKVQAVKDALENAIKKINAVIPAQASAENQLADKDFVNSSISTNTAYFIGTFDSIAALNAYAGTKTNNDYAFVQSKDSAGNTIYNRYKWNGSAWLFEYALNNSSFTANQWAAINSGATAATFAQLNAKTAKLSADGTAYSGNAASATKLATARNINGVAFDGTKDITLVVSANATHFGRCSTAAATQVKSVSIAGFALVAGARVSVLFLNGSTVGSLSGNKITQASAPTLNVQSTGAKRIKVGNAYAGPNFVNAGEVHDFVYDGSEWNDVTASVIFKGSNSNGNYVKHRDGKIEQWWHQQTSGHGWCIWTFAIPFSTVDIYVLNSATHNGQINYSVVRNIKRHSCEVGFDSGASYSYAYGH